MVCTTTSSLGSTYVFMQCSGPLAHPWFLPSREVKYKIKHVKNVFSRHRDVCGVSKHMHIIIH